MGSVYRKQVTKPLPPGAEITTRRGVRYARWTDRRGKGHTALLNAEGTRIVIFSKFVCKFRDGSGVVREVPTGCDDETAARRVLAELERRAELVKANVLTAAEDSVSDHANTPLPVHFDTYIQHLAAKGCDPRRMRMVRRRLQRVADDCGFKRLADLAAANVENWLVEKQGAGMSANTRNGYRESFVCFGNWCETTHRLVVNPFLHVPRSDPKTDPRRRRRALTEDELVKLLDVARQRPVQDALMVRRGKRKGQAAAAIRPEIRHRLEVVGWERSLIYKTLVLTGLRKGELASLTVGQLQLDGPVGYAILEAADEKNRQGSEIPLRRDLVADLRQWLAHKLEAVRSEAVGAGGPIPMALPANTPLFDVPSGLIRILDRDLVAAGIAKLVKDKEGKAKVDKRDDRGRTIDVHALRTTFGTHLSKGGVPLRTAQAAMRHSKPELTANVYTDPKLLDVAGALDALPALPLPGSQTQVQAATGTDGSCQFAPRFAPTADRSGANQVAAVKTAGSAQQLIAEALIALSGWSDKKKSPVTSAVTGGQKERVMGLEPTTFTLAT